MADYADLIRRAKGARKKRISTITGKATTLTPELEFQISLITYYDKRCRLDRELRENTRLYAVNPIPGKTARQADLSKRAGLRVGVFDLCLIRKVPFRITWLECKSGKGSYTEAQEGWLVWLADTPIQAHEIRVIDEFIRILDAP